MAFCFGFTMFSFRSFKFNDPMHRPLGRARLCPRHRLPRLGAGAALGARLAARLVLMQHYDSALRILADLNGGKSAKTLCVLNLAKTICILNMGVAKIFERWFCSVSAAPDASHQESRIFPHPPGGFRARTSALRASVSCALNPLPLKRKGREMTAT